MSEANPHGITFENVFAAKPPELIDEIVNFWVSLKVLPNNENTRKRANQVVFLARADNGKIAGISTTYAQMIPRLKSKMFLYRCMTHPEHRIPGLYSLLTVKTVEFLNGSHKTIDPDCIGVMAVMENKGLQKIRKAHTDSGLTFAGFNEKGQPIHLHFFKGARY